MAPKYSAPYEGKVPPQVANFYGMIANIDENLGVLRERLREWKLDDNTLLIFMTDNGSAAGREDLQRRDAQATRAHHSWAARASRRSGTGLARQQPAISRRPPAHIDIFPTLAELAGAKLPAAVQQQIQGRSLVPLLKDAQATWSDRYLVSHVGRWPAGTDVANAKPNEAKYANCSIRWRNYHAVHGGKKDGKDWELFDLTSDPGEEKDIAADHPEIVKQLDAEYDRWWAGAVPNMVNETAAAAAAKLKFTPYKVLYWNQFRGPGPNNVPPPAGFEFAK